MVYYGIFTEFCAVEIDFASYAMFSHFTIKHGTHVLSCFNYIIVCLSQANSVKYVNLFKRRIDSDSRVPNRSNSLKLISRSTHPWAWKIRKWCQGSGSRDKYLAAKNSLP